MDTDLLWLRIFSDAALISWIVVSLTTLRWFYVANGHRPIVSGIVGLSSLAMLSAVSLVYSAHHLQALQQEGWALWGSFSLRGYSILGALTLYVTGRRVMNP